MIATTDLADTAAIPATITTRDTATARARIAGVLDKLLVVAGDRVKTGQPIAIIGDTRLRQEVAAHAAELAAARAEASRAGAELRRIRFLHQEKVYADARLDAARASAEAADATVAALAARHRASSALEAQGVVRAPQSGTVLVADVPEGSAVGAGDAIATITAGPLLARLDMPERLAGRIAPGAHVTLDDAPDGTPGGAAASGAIAKIYPGASAGRVRADATIAGLRDARIGARAVAHVALGNRPGIAIPARFVARRFDLSFVRLVAADGKRAFDTPVELRPLPDGRVEILSGLKPGDRILAIAPAPTPAPTPAP